MLTDKQKGLQDVLDGLSGRPGIEGASLVSRDGFAILSHIRSLPSPDTFSAMSATLVGAAEAALAEIEADSSARVIAETGQKRLVALGATPEILLVIVGRRDAPLAEVLARAEAAASDVARILGA